MCVVLLAVVKGGIGSFDRLLMHAQKGPGLLQPMGLVVFSLFLISPLLDLLVAKKGLIK